MGFDGFSMHSLARELNGLLEGGRIDRITQPNRYSVVLSVRLPGKNFLLHVSTNSANPSAKIIAKNFENPPEPPVFCMVLRKHIETGRIAKIYQHGVDRLFVMDIDTLAAHGQIVTKQLVLEMMGKYSNIILVENGIIIDALRRIGESVSRVRTVLPNGTYELPPVQDKIDLFAAPAKNAIAKIRALPNEKLSKALIASCMGFGPVSAKETAFMAGLDANISVGALDDADFASLKDALESIKAACDEAKAPTVATDADGKILAAAAFDIAHVQKCKKKTFANCSELLEAVDAMLKCYTLPDRERFAKILKNETHRAAKKIGVLNEELAAADNAEEYRIRADNLMAFGGNFADHADERVTVKNIYSATGENIDIELDRRLTIVGNMQAYYRKYNKLKRAQNLLREQADKCRGELSYLESIEASLATSATLADIAEIKDELIAGGYLKEKAAKKIGGRSAEPLRFFADDGTEILVGKNNSQNDRLTFKIADKRNLWLHAKDIPGSHVIIRSINPSDEAVLFAAKLAARFSKAQDSSNVPVDFVECRFVKKPSGAKPGFVVFTNQNTIYVTPDDETKQLCPQAADD